MWLTALADVARATGLPVVEVDGWQTRGHGQMTDVKTIVCHHTGEKATGNYPSLTRVRDGRPDLAGPLAQFGLGRDGTVYVIAAGLCYHAGRSRDPSYTNGHAIGIEAEASGVTTWPAAQMAAYAALCKALADHYRVPVTRVLGHKETCAPVGRKVDPNFDMDAFRLRITNQEATVALNGVDISHHQGNVNITKLTAHTDFVIHKATQGTGYVDPTYRDRLAKLRATGVLIGSYHFADGNDPATEAKHYLSVAGHRTGELLALDFEGPIMQRHDPVGWCAEWIRQVVKTTGVVPVIYMSASTVTRFNWQRVIDMNSGLWSARWGATAPASGGWPFVAIWQHTSAGSIAGVPGRVDMNIFNGSREQWLAYGGGSAKPKPKPNPPAKPKRTAHEKALDRLHEIQTGLDLSDDAVAHLETAYQNIAKATSDPALKQALARYRELLDGVNVSMPAFQHLRTAMTNVEKTR